MNRQILSALIMGLLLLLLFSPFAAIALLMGILFIAAAFWMVTALAQGIFSNTKKSHPN